MAVYLVERGYHVSRWNLWNYIFIQCIVYIAEIELFWVR
jgi:hypothetical protein